jgi:putative restriction endonuclease
MNFYVGITDKQWFNFLRNKQGLNEVNFWRPSANNQFRALKPGELFLFKLHHPDDYIVGGGTYAYSSILPITLAWEAFEIANGANSLSEMRFLVEKYRKPSVGVFIDYQIGCILLEQPFFLSEDCWIPIPSSWNKSIQSGRRYDITTDSGKMIFSRLESALQNSLIIRETQSRFGEPILTFPRLGQGAFRILVTDVYQRRCAITKERTLPALDAAHIKPFSQNGPNETRNGILLRRDLHALFDQGYITISPSYNVEVSRRIKEEFENGRDYYRYHGEKINLPVQLKDYPSSDFLDWHNSKIFKG